MLQRCSTELEKTDTDVCPLKAILPYMVTRGTKSGPFLLTADNKPLTHQRFHTSLYYLLDKIGLTITLIASQLEQPPQQRLLEFQDIHIQMLEDGKVRHTSSISRHPAELTKLLAHHT